MKLVSSVGTALLLLVCSTLAHAEEVVRRTDVIQPDPSLMMQTEPGNPQSTIIYLNRCAGGCTIQSGQESAVNNTSSILGVGTANFSAWSYGDAAWNALVQCVREVYAPFNIQITDTRPNSGVYWMNVVAGTAAQGGFPNGVLGVSPGSWQCPAPLLNNTITYTFANDPNTSSDTNYLCWIVAQETAHSFGLDHEALALDAMTYIGLNDPTPPRHNFLNQNGQCGAQTPGDDGCYCPSVPTQNSYQRIMAIFGASAPSPPDIEITSPMNGEQVTPGFQVAATITDPNTVVSASLEIDGTVVQTITTSPYYFNAPVDLGEGTHRVTVSAVDGQGTRGEAFVDVIIGEPCGGSGDCPDGDVCVGGRCVPGSGEEGGLGTECSEDGDCWSQDCQGSNEGSYCVEQCEPGAGDCPSGFGCIERGDGGICWPGAEGDGGGGCLSADDETPTLPIALGIALAALMFGRRRIRRSPDGSRRA